MIKVKGLVLVHLIQLHFLLKLYRLFFNFLQQEDGKESNNEHINENSSHVLKALVFPIVLHPSIVSVVS